VAICGRRNLAAVVVGAALCAVAPATASAAPAGVFTLAAGNVATLTHTELIGCDATEWGYKLRSHPWQILGAKRQTCRPAGPFGRGAIPNPQPDVTIGPFPRPQSFRLFLIDEFPPAFTFFSDDHKHTTVTQTGTGTWRIAENDGAFGAHGPFSAYAPGPGQGSFRTTLTMYAPSSG
jgi:hypothetical protein